MWMQDNVIDQKAENLVKAAGMQVAIDDCSWSTPVGEIVMLCI